MRYIAFLRGINLGKRRPPMAQLRSLFVELGFEKVETFIASGNVLFTTVKSDPALLESHIARHLESALGYAVDTIVRSSAEVVEIGEMIPFPGETQPGNTVHVALLQKKLESSTARKLEAIDTGYDRFRVKGKEFYWLCRGRSSDSEVWKLPEAKALQLPTLTMRNMTSIRKLILKHLEGSKSGPASSA